MPFTGQLEDGRPFIATLALQAHGTGVVGDGKQLKFWIDPWLSTEPLKYKFPSLFCLEQDKRCNVADRIPDCNGSHAVCWNWKHYPATEMEIEELIQCHRLLSNVSLSKQVDRWVWRQEDGDGYSVKDARNWIKGEVLSVNNSVYQWCKWIPNKCNIFMWRASLNRIPTKDALLHRNIYVENGLCGLCGEVEESVDHLFSGCRFASGMWDAIASWCNIPRFYVFSLSDVLLVLNDLPYTAKKKDIMYGIIIIACWRIWKARNDKIFNGSVSSVTLLVADVKSLAFLWFKCRHKEGCIDWRNWCNFVLPVM
ncbi:uncharacterized protein LOC110918839 [Helianthus annuus]|uniref:uncharacterized protein LOC110918839 n=1 Tax=Helianthus annuus TaxID=4232 RepID=UPI00165306B9|nr:uncharacterized protein LOC110918839 [Helianthus annuus]